jgi:hypothetical protein
VNVSLLVLIALAIIVVGWLLVRQRVRAARPTDLGSISERWLSEHRIGRDR